MHNEEAVCPRLPVALRSHDRLKLIAFDRGVNVQVSKKRQMHRLAQPRPATDRIMRLGDFLIACVLLAITLPLMVIVVLAIKLESPGPVLDRQTCVGRCGRRFQMLKFRTAVHDPEHATPAWVAPKNIRLGRFIRHTRIEALPQLINVLRGEMSMIDIEAHSPSFLD